MDMEIKKIGLNGLYIGISGRIDLDSAVEFGTTVKDELDGIKELVIDFRDVTFISSFGLKVILELYKEMKEQGSMRLINVSESINNSFKMVGFDKFLNIE